MGQGRSGGRWLSVLALMAVTGCAGSRLSSPTSSSASAAATSDVKPAGHVAPRSPLHHDGLLMAEEAYRREEFAKAAAMFEDIADDTRNRPEVAERARFYQAEALRRQGYYPRAVDAYNRLLQDFPAGLYREQAVGQMYAIACEWLRPTAIEIDNLGKPEGERVATQSWVDRLIPANFDRKLPTFDTEGRALKTLEQAYYGDPTGPYADKALYVMGRVHFHRGNYKEAALYFQQLAETYDRSPLRDQALMLAIIATNNSSAGPQYDGRTLSAAMRLINSARATSPTLNREQGGKFLDEQAFMVRYQQAQKDFETAEFYRRTGHPGSAWFYYELVQRRYPGLKPFAEQAAARQRELKLEQETLKNETTMTAARRIWKQYVLGHELPTTKEPTTREPSNVADRLTQPPAPPGPLPSDVVPAEARPR